MLKLPRTCSRAPDPWILQATPSHRGGDRRPHRAATGRGAQTRGQADAACLDHFDGAPEMTTVIEAAHAKFAAQIGSFSLLRRLLML